MRLTPSSISDPLRGPHTSLGEEESETFVASDQQQRSSHALSVGSGVVM